MPEHVHTIELVYGPKHRLQIYSGEYQPEMMVRIINRLQGLIWDISDYEDDIDNIPVIELDGYDIGCELTDLSEDELSDRIRKANGWENE
ncbi:MAG: hypothetical protein GY799_02605 [Desulfobulbaceae bacterium]|nr:hypothetical protein [Desulfobulbaceae bacterium]